jgi:hypothetical protein
MRWILIVACALLLGCSAGPASESPAPPARARGASEQAYDYRVVKIDGSEKRAGEALTRMGRDGWRFAGVVVQWEGWSLVAFERPRAAP